MLDMQRRAIPKKTADAISLTEEKQMLLLREKQELKKRTGEVLDKNERSNFRASKLVSDTFGVVKHKEMEAKKSEEKSAMSNIKKGFKSFFDTLQNQGD